MFYIFGILFWTNHTLSHQENVFYFAFMYWHITHAFAHTEIKALWVDEVPESSRMIHIFSASNCKFGLQFSENYIRNGGNFGLGRVLKKAGESWFVKVGRLVTALCMSNSTKEAWVNVQGTFTPYADWLSAFGGEFPWLKSEDQENSLKSTPVSDFQKHFCGFHTKKVYISMVG